MPRIKTKPTQASGVTPQRCKHWHPLPAKCLHRKEKKAAYSLAICKSSHFTHFQPHFFLGVDGEAGHPVCHVVRHFSSAADEILTIWRCFAALSDTFTVGPAPVSVKL